LCEIITLSTELINCNNLVFFETGRVPVISIWMESYSSHFNTTITIDFKFTVN